MKAKRIPVLILCGALMLASAGCSTQETAAVTGTSEAPVETEAPVAEAAPDNSDDIFVSAYPAFTVTSQSLDGTHWIKACAYEGENASPQLSWEPVEGATTYVVYMVDLTANKLLHWKSDGITETNLPQGWASSSDYIGPNPPSGSTNQYNIYVFALKAPVERVKGSVRSSALKLQEFMDSLDTDAEGNTGNIVAVGRVVGYYTGKS